MESDATKGGVDGASMSGTQMDVLLDQPHQEVGIDALRCAIDQEQLVLYYQPKVSSRDGRIVGVEALIRWNHPSRGIIQPSQFIPLLEESGLILEFGTWVLKQAADDFCVWTEKGLAPLRIAVNV